MPMEYDPQYDPLVAPDPGTGRAYAPTYWVASAGTPPPDDGPVTHGTEADVVIIGSGSTGISTALYLAQEHGIRAVVLEANQTSWGCSSRSGGQGQNASGRLTRSQWIERWGSMWRRHSTPKFAAASRTPSSSRRRSIALPSTAATSTSRTGPRRLSAQQLIDAPSQGGPLILRQIEVAAQVEQGGLFDGLADPSAVHQAVCGVGLTG